MSALKKRLLPLAILISLTLLPDEGVTVIQDQHYVKVASTFPTLLQNCFLKKQVLKVRSTIACAMLCSQTPDCSMYCLRSSECSLLKARVTLKWEGYAGATAANSFDSCYSSWAYRDIAYLATASAQAYYGSRLPPHAIDGFACGWSDAYCTSIYSSNWMRIDLPSATAVSEIRLSVHPSSVSPEIYLGNSTTYTENTRIATAQDTVKDTYSVISTKPPQEVSGIYVHLIGFGTYIHLCELVVIVE